MSDRQPLTARYWSSGSAASVRREHPADRPFLKHFATYAFAGVLGQAAAVILLPVYARCLSPADFGVLDVVERVATVLGVTLMAGGVRQAAFAFYLQAPSAPERALVAPTVSALAGAVLLLSVAATAASAPVLAPAMRLDDSRLLVFGVLAAQAHLLLLAPTALMQARLQSAGLVATNLAVLASRLVLATTFVAVFRLGVFGAFLASLVVAVALGVPLTVRELRTGARPSMQMSGDIIAFAAPFVPTALLSLLLTTADRFFLLNAVGPSALGLYALGARIAMIAGVLITTPFFMVWSARLYAAFASPDAAVKVARALARALAAYSVCSTIIALFHPELLTILTTRAYAQASLVVAPLLSANALLFIGNFMEGAFYACRKTKYKPLSALAGTAVGLFLYAVLIPRSGILGAAHAFLAAQGVFAVCTSYLTRRVFFIAYPLPTLALLAVMPLTASILASQLARVLPTFLAKTTVAQLCLLAPFACRAVGKSDILLIAGCLSSSLRGHMRGASPRPHPRGPSDEKPLLLAAAPPQPLGARAASPNTAPAPSPPPT